MSRSAEKLLAKERACASTEEAGGEARGEVKVKGQCNEMWTVMIRCAAEIRS